MVVVLVVVCLQIPGFRNVGLVVVVVVLPWLVVVEPGRRCSGWNFALWSSLAVSDVVLPRPLHWEHDEMLLGSDF